MPFNGSGTFNPVYLFEQQALLGIKILAAQQDTQWADASANGLSLCLTRDGQGSAQANLPMNGYVHTGVGSATSLTNYTAAGQTQTGLLSWVIAGGSADAITASYTPAIAGLVDGMQLRFRAAATNTSSAPTFSPNGFTAHPITKLGGLSLSPADIVENQECTLTYNLANTRWELGAIPSLLQWVTPGEFFLPTDPDDTLSIQRAMATGFPIDFGDASNVYQCADLEITNDGFYWLFRGATLQFNGASTVRLLTLNASGGRIITPIFDGNNTQVFGSLVATKDDCSDWQMHCPVFQNVSGTHVGGSVTNYSNNQYGLSISPFGNTNFLVTNPKFYNIHNDNSGANGVTPTLGYGFCGGTFFYPDDFPATPTTSSNATNQTTGVITDPYGENITTILANGLSTTDLEILNDADLIRSTNNVPQNWILTGVRIVRPIGLNVGKRILKLRVPGLYAENVTCLAPSTMQYPMSEAFDLLDGCTVAGVNRIYASSAQPILRAFQTHDGNNFIIGDVECDYCVQGWEMAFNTTSTWSGWRIGNLRFNSVTTLGISNANAVTALQDCQIESVSIMAASGTHGIAGFLLGVNAECDLAVGYTRMTGCDFKVNAAGGGAKFERVTLTINDAAYTGSSSGRAVVEFNGGTTGSSSIGLLDLNIIALPDAYFSGSRPNIALFYGGNVSCAGINAVFPSSLLSSSNWLAISGDNMVFDEVKFNGIGTIGLCDNAISGGSNFTGCTFTNFSRLPISTGTQRPFIRLVSGKGATMIGVIDNIPLTTQPVISVDGGTAVTTKAYNIFNISRAGTSGVGGSFASLAQASGDLQF